MAKLVVPIGAVAGFFSVSDIILIFSSYLFLTIDHAVISIPVAPPHGGHPPTSRWLREGGTWGFPKALLSIILRWWVLHNAHSPRSW